MVRPVACRIGTQSNAMLHYYANLFMPIFIPHPVQSVIETLTGAGYEAYAVGGCVRDLLLGKKPKDWDVAASARPEQVQKIFPKNYRDNNFGTVTVLTGSADPVLKEVEVTTYRIDSRYSDRRRPDQVEYTASLKKDLARRDFTINAMALRRPEAENREPESVKIDELVIVDPWGGLKDLDARLIRAVGDPYQRFGEDALRLMRAVRLAAQLQFDLEEKTQQALEKQARTVKAVSQERIRDELVKIVMSGYPERGFNLLQQTGLLGIILPEVEEGVGVVQNKHHKFTVFEHSVKSLQYAAAFGYPLEIRLAALLHDVGKPRTRRLKEGEYTFHAHDIVGSRMAERIMKRLKFPRELARKVTHLARHHMFYYDVGQVTEAGARRLLRRVGQENFDDLIKLRIAERKGSGVPKAEPYRLRHLQFLVEKAAREPISVSQLAVRGGDIMTAFNLKPGPRIGGILNALLAEVLDDPGRNNKEYLLKRAAGFKDKDPEELKRMGEQAARDKEKQREEAIRRKYHV